MNFKHVYSDAICNQKIAILGSCAPPLGGVSIHISRVAQKFKNQNNIIKCFKTTVEYRYRFLFLYILNVGIFLLFFRPSQIYYHSLELTNALQELRLLLFLKKILKFKIFLVCHNCQFLDKTSKVFKGKLNRLMPHIDKQICIGNLTIESYRNNGIVKAHYESVEAAFIPPFLKKEKEILHAYPKDIKPFLKQRRPLIVVNASQSTLINNHHLYGFDLCLEAVQILQKEFLSIGLVLAYTGNDKTYVEQLNKIIKANDLGNLVFILAGQYQLWPLLKQTDLFVRPTLFDGDSISLQEALYFNVPVVASDAALRPEGTVIFRSGDVGDFAMKIKETLTLRQAEIGKRNRQRLF